MKKNVFLITMLSIFTIACSQKTEEKTTESTGTEKKSDTVADENAGYELNAEVNSSKNYELLIPDGYEVLDKAEGDINKDGISDWVLVLKSQQEKADEMPGEDVPGRKLLLLVKDSKGEYSRAAESSTAILAKNEGGAGSDDPYQTIEIKPGQFTITHMGGAAERWSYAHTFTYDKAANAWFLTEKETGGFSTMDPKDESMKTETPKDFGKINFLDFKQ